MIKKIFIVLSIAVFVLGISRFSFAMMCGEGHSRHKHTAQSTHEHQYSSTDATNQATPETTTNESENVGNKICPVSGERIDEKLKATYEYEGKIYNFCCASCIEEFKKDPEKYIKKVEEELKEKEKETTEKPAETHEGHRH